MISLRHVRKIFGNKIILDDVNLSINPQEILALIGENGSGKTTLLKLIQGEILPDGGEVVFNQETVGYLPQDPELGTTLENSFEKDTTPWQIEQALTAVGLDKESPTSLIDNLSGGQRTRLGLAKVIAADPSPTVLLLDEPTNNLDIAGMTWLATFIQSFRGSVILVSHDREFINRVATDVIELRQGKVHRYGGNYDFYLEQRANEREAEMQRYHDSLGEKKRLEDIRKQKLRQMNQTSSESFDKIKHESKSLFHKSKNSSQAVIGKQIHSLESRIDQMESPEKPKTIDSYVIKVSGETPQSKLVLRLVSVEKSYNKPVLSNVSLEIRGNERVKIAGPNGSGKTTLLKIAAGAIRPDKGSVDIGNAVSIGYFSQKDDCLNSQISGLENLQLTRQNLTDIFHQARRLGLTEADLKTKTGDLSRGQRAKLAFTKLLLESNHLLILDEPTNHLDIPTRERIESALKEYKGAILTASHDQYFIGQIGVTKKLDLPILQSTEN